MLSCLGWWGCALRASDFALRATTGHVDPTRRVQLSGLKNIQPALIEEILSSSFFLSIFTQWLKPGIPDLDHYSMQFPAAGLNAKRWPNSLALCPSGDFPGLSKLVI